MKLTAAVVASIYDCNGSNAQKWVIAKGTTAVQVAGTNFCLDAGSNPANGVQMKIWTVGELHSKEDVIATLMLDLPDIVLSWYYCPNLVLHRRQLYRCAGSRPVLRSYQWSQDEWECDADLGSE